MRTLRANAPLVGILAVTTAYAALRYNVFKGIAWEHLPLYVANKAVAWTSITLLAVAAVQAVARRQELLSSRYVAQSAALGAAHVLMTLVLLSPPRYPDLFDVTMQLTMVGELALLAGVIGAACAAMVRRSRAAALLLPVAVAGHCALLGARNWATPAKWPGNMPPITLICAVVAAVASVCSIGWALRSAHDRPRDIPEAP